MVSRSELTMNSKFIEFYFRHKHKDLLIHHYIKRLGCLCLASKSLYISNIIYISKSSSTQTFATNIDAYMHRKNMNVTLEQLEKLATLVKKLEIKLLIIVKTESKSKLII